MNHENLLTLSEAADILGLSRYVVKSWERAGMLRPARTTSRHRRYSESHSPTAR
jgi:DNA-binding transcriptional MerR regulator